MQTRPLAAVPASLLPEPPPPSPVFPGPEPITPCPLLLNLSGKPVTSTVWSCGIARLGTFPRATYPHPVLALRSLGCCDGICRVGRAALDSLRGTRRSLSVIPRGTLRASVGSVPHARGEVGLMLRRNDPGIQLEGAWDWLVHGCGTARNVARRTCVGRGQPAWRSCEAWRMGPVAGVRVNLREGPDEGMRMEAGECKPSSSVELVEIVVEELVAEGAELDCRIARRRTPEACIRRRDFATQTNKQQSETCQYDRQDFATETNLQTNRMQRYVHTISIAKFVRNTTRNIHETI